MLETVIDFLCGIAGMLPFECMKLRFMQEAFLGVLLTAPLAAAAGIQVVNFRMSFFSDAIGHSAFAGVALGLIFGLSPDLTMPLLALAIGYGDRRLFFGGRGVRACACEPQSECGEGYAGVPLRGYPDRYSQ